MAGPQGVDADGLEEGQPLPLPLKSLDKSLLILDGQGRVFSEGPRGPGMGTLKAIYVVSIPLRDSVFYCFPTDG